MGKIKKTAKKNNRRISGKTRMKETNSSFSKKDTQLRKIGIPILDDVPWGTHLCQFYQTKEDLIDILIPYFKAGLERNEFCMWITSEPLKADEAKRALKKKLKNIDDYIKKGQLEILDSTEWYTKSGKFDADEVLQGWVKKEVWARKQGYDGLRLTGNTFWLEKKDWEDFKNYEEAVNSVIGKYNMIAICSYSLDKCNASEIIDVVSNHQFALIKRNDKWHRIENPEMKKAEDALKTNQQLFETVVNFMPAAINLIRGSDLTLQLINPAYQAIAHGKDMIGKTLDELWPETEQNFTKLCRKVLATGEPYHVYDELNMIRRQPNSPLEAAYFSWSLNRVRLPREEGWGILNIAWETTLQKKIQEELLRNMQIFDQIQDGIIIVDSDFRIKYWNKGAEHLFGYSKSEAMGMTTLELLKPVYTAGERKQILDELKCGGTLKITLLAKHKNGTDICIDVHATRLTNDSGEITGFVVTYRDVSEREKAQKALRDAELKYRTVADNTYDFEFWINPEGRYLYASPSCKRITGYEPQDFLNNSGLRSHIVHPDDKERFQQHVLKERTGKKVDGIEYRILLKNGGEKWIHHICAPIHDEKGTFSGVRGTNRDITDQKNAENAVLENKKRLDFALEVSRIGAWDLDLVDHTAFRSLEHDRIFGYETLLPRWTYEMFLEHIIPEDRTLVDDKFKKAIDSKSDWNFECRIRRKDGAIRWIWAAGRPKSDEEGRTRRMAGIVQDITERKKMDDELRRKQAEIQTLFENSPAGLVLFDATPPYKVLVHNKYYQELFAEPFRSNGMVGLNIYEYAPEVEASGVTTVFDEVVRTKQSKNFLDFSYKSNPPNEYWFNWYMSPIIIDDKVVALVSLSLNVTERHKAEELLRETHDYLENLLNYANAPIIVWDRDFKITRFNHAFERLTGYSSKEMIGKDLNVLFPQESTKKSLQEIQRTLGGDYWESVEIPIRQKNGKTRIVLWNSANVYDCPGMTLIATIAQGQDITERKKIEEILRESETQQKRAQELAHLGSWDLDLINNHLSWSDEVYRIFGLRPQEFKATYEAFLDAIHPDDREIVNKTYSESISQGRNNYEIEHRIIRKNGEIRFVHEKCEHLRNESGKVIRSVGMVHDITKAKQAEAELARLASFPLKNPNPIIEIDLSGKIEYLNPISRKYFPDLEKKGINHPFLKGLKNLIPAIKKKKSQVLEVQIEDKFYLHTITYIPENNRIRIYSTDITLLKKTEEILQESEEKYRQIVENTTNLIMVTQPDGIISYLSPSSKEVLGFLPEELIGTTPLIFYPDDIEKVQHEMARALKGEKGSNFEYRILTKQGNLKWISHTWSPMIQDNKLQSVISIIADITEKKIIEEKIKKLNDNLMRRTIDLAFANKELETFSYSVSHDLRAPLRSIDGFSQALLEDYGNILDENGKEYLTRVRKATDRMSQLIDDMLRLSQLTRVEMSIQQVDLGTMATTIIENLKKTEPGRKVTFVSDKKLITEGDENLLKILLENLLGNAWKFTKKRTQTKIKIGKTQKGKDEVFFIRDNGAGFNMKYADKLFIPFQRLHDEVDYPGTGIGLGIVSRIIHRHGGRIWAEAEENKGATFYFTIGGKTNE